MALRCELVVAQGHAADRAIRRLSFLRVCAERLIGGVRDEPVDTPAEGVCSTARPLVGIGALHHFGAPRILLEVAEACQEIDLAVDRDRLVAPAPQRADA